MKFKVRIFLDDTLVEPSELSKLVISNPTIDRIINDIVDTMEFKNDKHTMIEHTEKEACSA